MDPRDVLAMSVSAILANKLRSVLTLVRIVAGVASIISVMTAISLVQAKIDRGGAEQARQGVQFIDRGAGLAGFNARNTTRTAIQPGPIDYFLLRPAMPVALAFEQGA